MNCSKCGNVLLNFEGAVVPENVQRICRQCSGVNSDYQEGMTRATTASTAANLRCSICDLPIQRNHGMCPKCRESAAAEAAEAANMAYAANQHRSDTWVKSLGDALVAAGYEDTRKDKQ